MTILYYRRCALSGYPTLQTTRSSPLLPGYYTNNILIYYYNLNEFSLYIMMSCHSIL